MVVDETHASYCFDTIISELGSGPDDPHPTPTVPDEQYPLFVSWHRKPKSSKKNDDYYELRGCIGTFSPMFLLEGLKQYALTSAFKDKRFEPVELDEVPHLRCSVSVLIDFLEADDCYDWEVGSHGIWIHFSDPNGVARNATYLPEVCSEQGWNKTQCLDSLIRKAGWKGRVTENMRTEVKVTRYSSVKVHLCYDEYASLRPSLML